MHTRYRVLSAAVLLTLAMAANATNKTPTPTPAPAANATAQAAAGAAAISAQRQGQGQYQEQQLDASQELEASLEAEQTNDQRNRQDVALDSSYTDASTYLYAPSVIPPECGVAGNAGGARGGDSAFLGVAWTSERCYSFRAAVLWAQLGAVDLACEMLADATRKQLKRRGITKLDCNVVAISLRKAAEATSTPPVDVVTREELNETVNRAFKASQSK